MIRFLRRLATALLVISLILFSIIWFEGQADPVVRTYTHHVANWPKGEPSVRLAFVSDIHVGEPDMPVTRFRHLADLIYAQKPDCVLIGGDLISDKQLSTRHLGYDEAMAPLAALKRVIIVPGNHDHWHGISEVRTALSRYDAILLENDVTRCGPLTVGGIDDAHTDHDNAALAISRAETAGGIPVFLTHSPDVFIEPQAKAAHLMLAGHNHCGQVIVPIFGAIGGYPSRTGDRYACGVYQEGGRTLIVSAGLGMSVVPFRWNAPPDVWIVTVGP